MALTAALACFVLAGMIGSPAGASVSTFSSHGDGYALRVTVDFSGFVTKLPAGAVRDAFTTAWATANLPSNFVVDEKIVNTASDATGAVTKALSVLASGTSTLNQNPVAADGVGQNNTSNLSSSVFPPTGAALLNVSAGVLKASVIAGPKVNSNGSIDKVDLTLTPVNSALPPEVQAAFATLVAAINTAKNTATSSIQGAVNTVSSTLTSALPSAVQTQLTGAGIGLGALGSAISIPDAPNPLTAGFSTVTGLASDSVSQKGADGSASSDASSSLKGVSILGGFLSAGLISLSSHSEVAATPGSAKNATSCNLGDVRLGGTSGVSLDGKNVYANVNGTPVAVPVTDAPTTQTLVNQVNSVLAQAGITVTGCDVSAGKAATDGTSASTSVSALKVVFAPAAPANIAVPGGATYIAAGSPLGITVTIDPTVQTNAQGAAGVSPASLPRTGAPAAATAATGIFLLAAGAVMRRRESMVKN